MLTHTEVFRHNRTFYAHQSAAKCYHSKWIANTDMTLLTWIVIPYISYQKQVFHFAARTMLPATCFKCDSMKLNIPKNTCPVRTPPNSQTMCTPKTPARRGARQSWHIQILIADSRNTISIMLLLIKWPMNFTPSAMCAHA